MKRYRNNSIKPGGGGGGGLLKTRPSKEGGGLIQKSGKYLAKGPKKRLEVLKMNWIKWCDHGKTYFKELCFATLELLQKLVRDIECQNVDSVAFSF